MRADSGSPIVAGDPWAILGMGQCAAMLSGKGGVSSPRASAESAAAPASVRRIAMTEVAQHASATDGTRLNPSVVIDNSGTLHSLREAVLGEWWAWEAQLGAVRVEIAGGA